MVILQKPPDLPQQRQVLDLHLRQLAENDARAAIELVVQIDRGLGPLDLWRVPNGFAVHQQLQIVRPHPPGSSDQDAEVELLRLAVDRKRNRVLRPVVRALDLTLLHVVEGKAWPVSVLAHPQPDGIAHTVGSQEPPPLNPAAGEIHREVLGDGGEGAGAGRSAFQPDRPSPAVDDFSIHENGPRWTATPAAGGGPAVLRLEAEHRFEFGPGVRILGVTRNSQRRAQHGQHKASHGRIVGPRRAGVRKR